jgi:hypothetical protein
MQILQLIQKESQHVAHRTWPENAYARVIHVPPFPWGAGS